MQGWRRTVLILLAFVVGGCSDDAAPLTSDEQLFQSYLQTLVDNLDDIGDAGGFDFDVPDAAWDFLMESGYLGEPEEEEISDAVRGATDLGKDGWSLAVAHIDLDSGGDVLLGYVGAGFRTSEGTLEAFAFVTEAFFSSSPDIASAVYVSDLNAADFEGKVYEGTTENTFYTQNEGNFEFSRDDCGYGEGAARGGPSIGLFTREIQYSLFLEFSDGVEDLWLWLPDGETWSEPIDVVGTYIHDTCD